MLTEEAHHLFVGDTGLNRITRRTAELMNEHGDDGVRDNGGIPLDILQRYINLWYSLSLDLFGGEVSSNAADYFATGLKGRWKEDKYEEHTGLNQIYTLPQVVDGRFVDEEVPLRNAMNEVLRDAYVDDCMKGLNRWNKSLDKAGLSDQLTLPDRRFHRHQGIYADYHVSPTGELIDEATWNKNRDEWLPTEEDEAFVRSLMKPVYEPGKMASWIAPPLRGINGQPLDFEYVRL